MSSDAQLVLDLAGRAATGIEDFMPAPCNREALAWIARWPAWPAPALVIHGPPGSGKSHLAAIWATRAGARRLETGALPRGADLAGLGACLLDPAWPVDDETALLHVYNAVQAAGGHLLLVARQPVAAWPVRLPDLASRLRAAPAAAIGPPDDALLGALLVKLFDDRQLAISEGVLGYLIRHMERSFAAARAVVAALDARSLRDRRPVTVALVRDVLQTEVRPED